MYYVPSLDISLYSVKQHMKMQGCFEHSENDCCTLAYPTFSFNVNIDHKITFKVTSPPEDCSQKIDFDTDTAQLNAPKPSIPFHFQQQHSSTVEIASTFKTKPLKYIPSRATPGSIGYDLQSVVNTSIPPQSRKAISLGFSIAIPPGLYGHIAPRSGLALNRGIDVTAGVIDPDYRGEVKVVLVNSSQKKFDIKEGDKIAQLIFETAATPAFKLLSQLNSTVRNEGGFGRLTFHDRPMILTTLVQHLSLTMRMMTS